MICTCYHITYVLTPEIIKIFMFGAQFVFILTIFSKTQTVIVHTFHSDKKVQKKRLHTNFNQKNCVNYTCYMFTYFFNLTVSTFGCNDY